MEYSPEERGRKIIDACMEENGKNPVEIFRHIADQDFIRIHGPEHHILDGATLLTAFYNAGGKINLVECLEELMNRGCLWLSQLHWGCVVHHRWNRSFNNR